MRKSRYSEAQIVGILKEPQAGLGAAELCRKYGISERDVLQVALEVRRAGGVGGETATEPGGGERQAEAAVGGGDAGRVNAQGDGRKNF